jgi:DNA anti-recombination protein RmuC
MNILKICLLILFIAGVTSVKAYTKAPLDSSSFSFSSDTTKKWQDLSNKEQKEIIDNFKTANSALKKANQSIETALKNKDTQKALEDIGDDLNTLVADIISALDIDTQEIREQIKKAETELRQNVEATNSKALKKEMDTFSQELNQLIKNSTESVSILLPVVAEILNATMEDINIDITTTND